MTPYSTPVHALKKIVHERQIAGAIFGAREIALNDLKLLVSNKISHLTSAVHETINCSYCCCCF